MKRLLKLGAVAALIGGIVKLSTAKRHWMRGTEDELRGRVRDKFADRVPPEKLQKVEDRVVEHARRRGTLVE